MPPAQQQAATTPALRGPARSSQLPQMAADEPKITKNTVYIHTKVVTCQSQLVVKSWVKKLLSAAHLMDSLMPKALDNGSQNTEKP